MAKVDPRLVSKLNSSLDNEKIGVVVGLNLEKKTKANVSSILGEAELASNQKPENLRFYEKLGFLVLEAKPQYIQKLIENPNISTVALAKDDDFYMVK